MVVVIRETNVQILSSKTELVIPYSYTTSGLSKINLELPLSTLLDRTKRLVTSLFYVDFQTR